MILTMNAALDY